MSRRWYTNPESGRRTEGYRKTEVVRAHRRRTPAELAALPDWTLTIVLPDRIPGLDTVSITGKGRPWLMDEAVKLLDKEYPLPLWGSTISATLTRPATVRRIQFQWQRDGWTLIEGTSFRRLRAA